MTLLFIFTALNAPLAHNARVPAWNSTFSYVAFSMDPSWFPLFSPPLQVLPAIAFSKASPADPHQSSLQSGAKSFKRIQF